MTRATGGPAMRRSVLAAWALGALWVAPTAAARADQGEPNVAIVALEGRGGGTVAIAGFQTALGKLRGVTVESSKNFLAEANAQGAGDRVADDPKALSKVAGVLHVDAIIRGEIQPGRKKASVLQLTVYNGGDGAILGEHSVNVPRGKFNAKIWAAAAKAVEPSIRRGDYRPPKTMTIEEPVPVSPPPTEQPEQVAEEEAPVEDEGPPADVELLRLRVGPAFVARSFKYTPAADSEEFQDEGITYDSALAPGVALQGELYPLVPLTRGFARNFGLGVRFEKVFLTTRQKVTAADGSTVEKDLDTNHHHFGFGLRYRHRFGNSATAPEIGGEVGMGFLTFELADNPEYRGTSYQYFDAALSALVPLGTPYAAAQVELRYLPSADMGDTVEEVGKEASTSGYGLTAGLASHLGEHFSAHAAVDYTVFNSDVSGIGRGGKRKGKSAEDSYLGFRLMGGYRF